MIIAIGYCHENVFPHFGQTSSFLLAEVAGGKLISSNIVSTEGASHRELIPWLKHHDVSVCITGHIGGGAVEYLQDQGITVIAGAEGKADDVLSAYLSGKLVSQLSESECCEGEACHEGEK